MHFPDEKVKNFVIKTKSFRSFFNVSRLSDSNSYVKDVSVGAFFPMLV